MNAFELHPRLEADTFFIADWSLSRVLLMNDRRFPWLILAPRRPALNELHELPLAERLVLIEEIARAAKGLKEMTLAAKINIGALGNLVPQLHMHVIARRTNDAAWPGAVWGSGMSVPYDPDAARALKESLSSTL